MTRSLATQIALATLMLTACGGAPAAKGLNDKDPREAREGVARDPIEKSGKAEKPERTEKPQKEEKSGGGHSGHH